jgi:predicted NBD/HSP70 family sugar kinase
MNHKRILGNSQIREDHKTKVLNYIRINNAASRTDIYKNTSISKPTVTRVIEQLLQEGLVIEGGTAVGESDLGRKPVYVKINPSACYCIGVNISKSAIQASIIDLSMNIIFKKTTSIKHINDVEGFKQIVLSCINEILEQVKSIDRSKILGIGIGVPGTVDYNKGTIMAITSKAGIINVNLKDFIEERLNLQVLIDNNAKTRALGEYWYGYGVGYRNIIFVVCSEGIGSGIILDGNLLRGKNNVTGEFGQMIINSDGRYSSIESCCSLSTVENSVKAALKQGKQSVLLELYEGDIEAIDYKLICKAAAEGDLLCMEKLEQAACLLSIGLYNTMQIVSPEIIILSGELFDENEYFYELVKEYTKDRLSNISAQDTIFARRKVVDGLYEIGAATLVYKRFFQD